MIDGLPGFWAGVYNEPKSFRVLFAAKLRCDGKELCDKVGRSETREFRDIREVFARHHEQVFGSLWIDVGDDDDVVILMHDFRGNLSRGNFAE